MKQKSVFFFKIKNIEKRLGNLTIKNREKTQNNKIRNKKREIKINTKEIEEVIRDYYENIYSNKLENLKQMSKFLETYDHSKLNQEDINHLNRSVT
jgi:thymidine phosphorylase